MPPLHFVVNRYITKCSVIVKYTEKHNNSQRFNYKNLRSKNIEKQLKQKEHVLGIIPYRATSLSDTLFAGVETFILFSNTDGDEGLVIRAATNTD